MFPGQEIQLRLVVFRFVYQIPFQEVRADNLFGIAVVQNFECRRSELCLDLN